MPNLKTLIISEIGSVHDGSFGNALKLIELAAACGADVVKFQTHLPDAETLPNAPSPSYFKGEPRMDYFRRTGFSLGQWRELKAQAEACKVNFISSPFSIEAVDLLEEVGVAFYKVPSGEVTNIPLLEKIAATGRPAILSSGMNDWAELDQAVDVLRGVGGLTLMQCSSAYPCPPERVGLNVLDEMKERYGLPVGLSDHTRGLAATVAAVARGAVMVEKHLTFHRGMYGSDAKNSAEPYEFQAMVEAIRAVEVMLANPVDKDDLGDYGEMKSIFEKSLVAAADLKAGTRLERKHLTFKKPGDGIRASEYSQWLGCILANDVRGNTQLSPEDFE